MPPNSEQPFESCGILRAQCLAILGWWEVGGKADVGAQTSAVCNYLKVGGRRPREDLIGYQAGLKQILGCNEGCWDEEITAATKSLMRMLGWSAAHFTLTFFLPGDLGKASSGGVKVNQSLGSQDEENALFPQNIAIIVAHRVLKKARDPVRGFSAYMSLSFPN